jgi:peptide/nickel transport system ATP-binding protein
MGLVLITHDLGVVARIADRVAVMYAGEIVETGPVHDVFEHPRHPYTQGLLRCIPVPGRTRRGERLGAIPGMVPAPIGELHGCQFRNRCDEARPECAATVPLRQDGGQSWRCVLPARAPAGGLAPVAGAITPTEAPSRFPASGEGQ